MNDYRYVIEMPARGKYFDEYEGTFEFDHYEKPDVYPASMLRQCLYNYYMTSWDLSSDRYKTQDGAIKELMNRFAYKVSQHREIYLDGDHMIMVLTLRTDALGEHLIRMMDQIYDDLKYQTSGHGHFLSEAKIRHRGWMDYDKKNLVDCEHQNNTRLNIMNDENGVIVVVCECNDCKKLFKKAI